MMVLYGKKTWWMLRPEVLDATEWTVDSGYDNERVDVTPLSHPHLPWVRADLYPGDVLIVPPFVWHMVLSDPDGMPHVSLCRVHVSSFSVHVVRMQCAYCHNGTPHAALCRVHVANLSVHVVRLQCAYCQNAVHHLSSSVCMM